MQQPPKQYSGCLRIQQILSAITGEKGKEDQLPVVTLPYYFDFRGIYHLVKLNRKSSCHCNSTLGRLTFGYSSGKWL